MPVDDFILGGAGPFDTDDFNGGGFDDLSGLGDVPSSMEIAQMSPEELAKYFGEDVAGFDIDEFMKRFGRFIAPFDETKIGLMEEGFQLDTGFLGEQTAFGMGRIQSNMALSAGAEKQRAFVMGEYASKMGQMGLGLKAGIYGEYERQAGDRLDYFRRLAEAEVFTEDYWKRYEFEEKGGEVGEKIFGEGGTFGDIGGFFGGFNWGKKIPDEKVEEIFGEGGTLGGVGGFFGGFNRG